MAAYKGGARAVQALPRRAVAPTGRALGAALGRVSPGRRRMLERHLRRVHGPGLSGRALRQAVRASLESYGRYWVESFRLPALAPEAIDAAMTTEGLDVLDAALAAGNGAICALPHLGGWDFGGVWLARRGYPITVVVEPLEPRALFEWFAEFRRALGMTVVPLGPEAGSAVLRALRANEVVGLLSDRDIQGGGVEVELFGERTTLPPGPATLALRTGAPLLPTAVYFRPGGGHHGVVRPPVPVERHGRLRDDIARITQLLAHELESLIRAAPEQWHLLQPNWPSDLDAG